MSRRRFFQGTGVVAASAVTGNKAGAVALSEAMLADNANPQVPPTSPNGWVFPFGGTEHPNVQFAVCTPAGHLWPVWDRTG